MMMMVTASIPIATTVAVTTSSTVAASSSIVESSTGTTRERARTIVTAVPACSAIEATSTRVATRGVSAANCVVDIENNLSANRDIKEGRRISSEKLNCARNLSASVEDNLNTVSVAGKGPIIIGDPDDLERFDDGDDLGGIAAEGHRTGVGKTFEVDDFKGGGDDKETGLGDDKLEGRGASGNVGVVRRSTDFVIGSAANVRATGTETVVFSIDNRNDREVNLIRNNDRGLS